MKNIRMIVTDLDMTVLHTDKSVSEYTRDILNRCAEKNIITAIATARYYIGAEKYINALIPDYEITTDGTMTYKNGKFMYGRGFDTDTTNGIIHDVMNINENLELTVATNKCIYWNDENISESSVLYKAVYNNYVSPLSECAYKIVAKLPDKSIAENIGLRYDCKVISYRGENRYGFISKMAGKIQAIRQLADYTNIRMSEVAAFGDDINDLEMIKNCGIGVAVANAIDEVKADADYICDTNDNDGVAKWIEENVFEH